MGGRRKTDRERKGRISRRAMSGERTELIESKLEN